MRPKTIIHNQVSLDGAVTGFDFTDSIGLSYEIAGRLKADIILVGSRTAKMGIKMFMERVPREKSADRVKPAAMKNDPRPLWVIPDTRGAMKGLLHVVRGSGYCRDAVILVSKKTPAAFIRYLEERGYDYHVVGKDRVDFKKAFALLKKKYNARIIRSDSGAVLNSRLLEEGLADEISLLVAPVLAGGRGLKLFGGLTSPGGKSIPLKLLGCKTLRGKYLAMKYLVLKTKAQGRPG